RKALYRGGACGKRVELSQKRVRHHFSARRKIVSDTVSVRLQTQLPGHEHQEVRGLPDPDFERFALTVPGLSVDPEQYGLLRRIGARRGLQRSEEHTSELQSRENLVCRLLLEKKKT